MDNNICVPLYSLWYFQNLLKCPQNTLAGIAIEARKALSEKNKYMQIRDLNLSHFNNYLLRDFLGSPVVKTLLPMKGPACLSPVRGVKIPHDLGPKIQNIKQKQYCKQFNEDFKNGQHQKKKNFEKLQIHNYFLSPY